MNDAGKTKAQLIEELNELRRQISEHRVIEGEPGDLQYREIIWGVQHRLRDAVAKMQSSDDIRHVLSVLKEGLQALEIRFQDCGINLIDPRRDPAVRSLSSLGRGEEWISPGQAWGQDFILQIWKDGVPVYRRDLQAEDVYGERDEYLQYFGHSVRSVVDVPFAHGTLAVNSREPDAFTEKNIADLMRLTTVLEEGFRRVDDLQALEQRNRELEDKDRLLIAFHRIGQTILSSLDIEQILGILTEQVVEAGVFRSLTISLVDEKARTVEQRRGMVVLPGGEYIKQSFDQSYDLDTSPDILADVVRRGRFEVVEGWDKKRYNPAIDRPENFTNKVAYFIPIKQKGRIVAVLATGSLIEEKEEILHRIEVMEPLLGQVAIALEHAGLYEKAQEDITERKQAEQEKVVALAVQKVRNEILQMQAEEDWSTVADLAYRELKNLMAFDDFGINIVDSERETFFCYVGSTKGVWRGDTMDFLPTSLKEAMASGEAIYRRNRGEMEQCGDNIGMSKNSVIDVPFMDGTIAANSTQEDAFSESDIQTLKQFAQVISEAHRRLQDLAERERLERELIRLERLRAVGELSAGVSHNLNNILTSVLGPAQLLKRKTDDPDLLREADEIISSAQRARDLVHELHLSVRTAGEESLTPVSVDQVIQQAIQASRPRWKDEAEARGISIEMATHWGEVPSIRGTETGLHAIFTNLIFNAVDAMPKGGTVTIRTERAGDQVQITFADTGIGMDEETCRRVFEPFFTTKMDVGSGLGLSTAYNAITGWGGGIEVDSTPGEGTTFSLHFPVWTEAVAGEQEESVSVVATRPGKILVVDDDEAVCHLLARLLGEQHEVETVANGRQALGRFGPERYDVVLIDLGMSGMPGDELLREMRQIDQLVVAVLITGWDLPDSDARVASFDFQVQKPFDDLDQVEDVVARALEVHGQRTEEGS